jgi:hypothetical protein
MFTTSKSGTLKIPSEQLFRIEQYKTGPRKLKAAGLKAKSDLYTDISQTLLSRQGWSPLQVKFPLSSRLLRNEAKNDCEVSE